MKIKYSPSTIKLGKNCLFNLYCKLTRQKKDPEEDKKYANGGNCVHDPIEYYYNELADLDLDIAMPTLQIFFIKKWNHYELGTSLDKQAYWTCLINILKRKIKPTHVEYEYNFSNLNYDFIGRADVVNFDVPWIGDWKTSNYNKLKNGEPDSKTRKKIEEYRTQLMYYAMCHNKETGRIPHCWVYFAKVDIMVEFDFTAEQLKQLSNDLDDFNFDITERFETEDFPRSLKNCYYCKYKKVCNSNLLRETDKETFGVKFHLKKNKLMLARESGLPENLQERIEASINYRMKNAEFIILSMLKRGIHCDGIKKLYKRKYYGGECNIGYLIVIYGIIKDYCKNNDLKFVPEVIDYRTQDLENITVPDKLIVDFTLDESQIIAVEKLIKNRWGIIEYGTGGGKTAISAEAIRRTKLKTLFVIDNKDLLLQTKDEYEKMLNVKCGIVGMGLKDFDKPIVLATIQTLNKHLKDFSSELAEFGTAIFDECVGGDSRILTEDGTKKIKTIYEEQYFGKVLSWNDKIKTYEWKPVLGHHKTEKRIEYYRIYFNNRIKPLKITPDHKLFTTVGWVEAKDLTTKHLLLMKQFKHKSYHASKKEIIIIEEAELQINRIIQLRKLNKIIKKEQLKEIKINKIESSKYSAGIHFYDIEVKDNHNFFVNGVLSHNCHIIATDSFEKLSKYLVNTKYRFGFSATARRKDGNQNIIFNNCGHIVYSKKANELIKDGRLVPPTCIFYKYKSDSFVSGTWQDEYRDGIVDNKERNKHIIEIAKKSVASGLKVMILVRYVEHGKALAEALNCDYIYGKTKNEDRVNLLDKFKKDSNLLIGNVKIFNKGLNIKKLDMIINTTGNSGTDGIYTDIITTQTCGRALRKAEGKTKAYYIDFYDDGEYLRKHSQERIKALQDEGYNVKILKR